MNQLPSSFTSHSSSGSSSIHAALYASDTFASTSAPVAINGDQEALPAPSSSSSSSSSSSFFSQVSSLPHDSLFHPALLQQVSLAEVDVSLPTDAMSVESLEKEGALPNPSLIDFSLPSASSSSSSSSASSSLDRMSPEQSPLQSPGSPLSPNLQLSEGEQELQLHVNQSSLWTEESEETEGTPLQLETASDEFPSAQAAQPAGAAEAASRSVAGAISMPRLASYSSAGQQLRRKSSFAQNYGAIRTHMLRYFQPAGEAPRSICPNAAANAEEVPPLQKLIGRKKREVQRYDSGTRYKKQLENHRRYDARRRVLMNAIFDDLRSVVHSSNQLLNQPKDGNNDKQHEQEEEQQLDSQDGSHRKKRKLRRSDSQEFQEHGQGDGEGAMLMHKPLSMQVVSTMAQHQLFAAASEAIRSLQTMKEQLESEISTLSIDDSVVALSASAASSSSMEVESAQAEESNELRSLLSTVSAASQFYHRQCTRFHALMSGAPKVIRLTGDLMPEFAVFGLNSLHIASVMTPKMLQPLMRVDAKPTAFQGKHRPQFLQILALCSLLAKQFTVTDDSNVLSKQRYTPSIQELNQFLYESVKSQQYASSAAASKSASTSKSTWSPTEDLHPLSQYSLPPRSFQILREVLNSLSALSRSAYYRLIPRLLSHASLPFPAASLRNPPGLRLTSTSPPLSSATAFIFHEYFTPTYEQVQCWASLFRGDCQIMTATENTAWSPGERTILTDFDFTLLWNPAKQPGEEVVGVVAILKKVYLGGTLEEWQRERRRRIELADIEEREALSQKLQEDSRAQTVPTGLPK